MQKNQLIKSIVSRYEDKPDDEASERRDGAPARNPFLGKFNEHV